MPKRISNRFLFFLILALACLAAGRASTAEKLNTAFISATPTASAPIWIAKEMGFFEKNGFDATVIFISGSIRGIQAILAGDILIGEGGGPGLVSARLAGGDVVAIAGTINVLPYYLVAQPSIKKPEELRGKIGGNHIAGTTAEFALRMSLKKLGIDPLKDVQLRVIGGTIERMAALQKGLVHFTVVTEAGKTIAEKNGFPTVVDMIAQGIPFPQNGIYTSGKMIRERPDAVRRYVKAYVQAIHYYKTHKEESLKVLRKYSRVDDRTVLEDSWEWHTRYFPNVPYPTMDGYQLVLQDMAASNPKAAKASVKEMVDMRFIKELEDSGFIKALYGK